MKVDLAARMEQEIYRCAIRDSDCDRPLHIFLFRPPQGALDILLHRFAGCSFAYEEKLPSCVAFHKNTSRSYTGQPTAFSRLASYLETWNGQPVRVSAVRDALEISPAVWKDLMKDARVLALFEQNAVVRSGRGCNAALAKSGVIAA